MKNYDLILRPIHYACVSGGKDSLAMIYLILNMPDKYPLDMVVHYDMEMDYPFVINVIDLIKQMCEYNNIKFVTVKSKYTFESEYNKSGYPNRVTKWCERHIKQDCVKQIERWIKSQNCRPVAYIGLCADEEKRFKYEIGNIQKGQDTIYPLAEEGIIESDILEWARKQKIFNDWYMLFDRQGCMGCPLCRRKELAYIKVFYPKEWERIEKLVKASEDRFDTYTFGAKIEKVNEVLDKKWIPRLLEEMKEKGLLYND